MFEMSRLQIIRGAQCTIQRSRTASKRGGFSAVNRVTVSDLITFMRQTDHTKAEGKVLGALAHATKG
jgi:hypothetical protein